MDCFNLKENILLCLGQPSILPTTKITWQIFLFDGLASKYAQAQIVFIEITTGSNENYLFCDQAWKHYPIYIISQTKCTTNIFIWQSYSKAWFHGECCHSNYQMLRPNVVFVSLPSLKMFLVFFISHKCTVNIFVWQHSL